MCETKFHTHTKHAKIIVLYISIFIILDSKVEHKILHPEVGERWAEIRDQPNFFHHTKMSCQQGNS